LKGAKVKKGIVAAASASALAVAALLPLTAVQVTAAGAAGLESHQGQPGAIKIESWLYLVPSENVLSATVWDCFQITGAITDEGGGPTWDNDSSYYKPNTLTTGGINAASKECADKVPAGGFIAVPPPEPGQYQFARYVDSSSPGGLTTIYAVHTIAGARGDIYITFAGTYNFTNSPVAVQTATGTVDVQPLTTGPQCTWLITGGTGAYTGLQGDGTCFANAQNTFPWINHTENGQVWWTGRA
jgi:hypothetical protein